MKSYKTSAILSCYNGAEFISEQLQSILDQSRLVDEVLIGDDGSTDETVAIVKDFIRKNELKNWKIFVNSKNLGYGENFYRLLRSATGDCIFLSDQDDIWVYDRVEKMASIMEEHPEIGLLNTASRNFSGEKPNEESNQNKDSLQKIVLNRKTYYLQYPGCVMCVSKSFFEEICTLWKSSWAHDTFLWAFAMLSGKCYSVEYVSLLRRIHSHQTSGKLGHSYEKRLQFLSDAAQNSKQLCEYAVQSGVEKRQLRLYQKIAKCDEYRFTLMKGKKVRFAVPLLFYLKYYKAQRSYLLELGLAFKQKFH